MDRERFANSPIGDLVRISGSDARTRRNFEHVAYAAHPLAEEPRLANRTWRAVAQASSELGRMDQIGSLIPNPGLLRRPLLRREAQSTSSLEGTYVPLEEVLAAGVEDQAAGTNIREVLNYEQAANGTFDVLGSGAPITCGLLEAAQKIVVTGTRDDDAHAGAIRSTQVVIGSHGAGIETARFVPMPPGPPLNAAVQDLVQWIETPASNDRDPIVGAAMAHYQFEALHPFTNGNGRVGRLLIVLQLMRRGLIGEPLLALSPWFDAHRTEYLDHLAEVSASGNWDDWVTFFANAVAASARDSARRASLLLKIREEYVELLTASRATGLIREVVELLVEAPYLTIPSVQRRIGRTYPSVKSAVERLVELGILQESVKQHNIRRFNAPRIVGAIVAPPQWD